MSQSPRRKARELALQILFQREFMPTADTAELFQLFQNHFLLEDGLLSYSQTLVDQVLVRQKDIDRLIERYSINWNIKRLSLVDLNILRLAICEMLFITTDPVPPVTAMNEAIEIAKKYSAQDAPAFINGLLDQIHVKEIKGE